MCLRGAVTALERPLRQAPFIGALRVAREVENLPASL
jgi:hypothetical protein